MERMMKLRNSTLFNVCLSLSFSLISLKNPSLFAVESLSQMQCAISPSNLDQSRGQLLSHLAGEWISRSLYVATKLEIADHLQQSPKSIQELARLTQTESESLHRILRLLVSIDIFQENEEGIFSNNQTSSLLAKNHPSSLYALTLWYGEEMHSCWDELLNSIKSGTPAFEIVHQKPVFAFLKENPTNALHFQEAMKEKSKAVIQSTLQAYNFSSFQSVYDIGAGYGQFMQAILHQYPHLNGLIFDLPEVIDVLPQKNPTISNNRCRAVAGDFFADIPSGGDVYILKSVLHDWNDEEALKILRNCFKAMSANSRLLIVETVLLPKQQAVYANCMDILMLAVTGGKERTLASFENLLDTAGFKINTITPTSTEFSIIEACKRS